MKYIKLYEEIEINSSENPGVTYLFTTDEEGYEKDQLMPCNSYEDFKAALEESIWGDF